jgi:hypothetical protein
VHATQFGQQRDEPIDVRIFRAPRRHADPERRPPLPHGRAKPHVARRLRGREDRRRFIVGAGAHGDGCFDRDSDLEAFAVPENQTASALALFDEVRKRISFAMPFYTKNRSFYQDRLGTNIGKAPQKREMRFLTQASQRREVVFRTRKPLLTPDECTAVLEEVRKNAPSAIRKRHYFLSFPYVCPEPVLVKPCILYINGAKTRALSLSLFLNSIATILPC